METAGSSRSPVRGTDSTPVQVVRDTPALEPSPVSLAARGLDLAFGSKQVLQGVDLEFPEGSVTALLGPTGSGKTTFLRTLNRMNDNVSAFSHSGDVEFEGRSIWSYEPMVLRRRVGMLFQRPNPFPMSILDNVVSGVRAHRIADRRQARDIAEARLREVGLWDAVHDRLHDSPFRLSGGQQQLLCLARALAVGPDVLLLDEPTSSLDPVSTEVIEELVRTLVPALTIVVVTHNLPQTRRLSQRTAFFYGGRLVEAGETAQVLEDPQEPETQRYVSGRIG